MFVQQSTGRSCPSNDVREMPHTCHFSGQLSVLLDVTINNLWCTQTQCRQDPLLHLEDLAAFEGRHNRTSRTLCGRAVQQLPIMQHGSELKQNSKLTLPPPHCHYKFTTSSKPTLASSRQQIALPFALLQLAKVSHSVSASPK